MVFSHLNGEREGGGEREGERERERYARPLHHLSEFRLAFAAT